MTTLARLQNILMKDYSLKREALTPDAQLADLDIDSLGVMELLFSVEDEFALDVPNDKQDLNTIGDVVDYIDRLIEQQHGQAAPEGMPSGAPIEAGSTAKGEPGRAA